MASLPLKICARPNSSRCGPCCSNHGCTGRAYGLGPAAESSVRGTSLFIAQWTHHHNVVKATFASTAGMSVKCPDSVEKVGMLTKSKFFGADNEVPCVRFKRTGRPRCRYGLRDLGSGIDRRRQACGSPSPRSASSGAAHWLPPSWLFSSAPIRAMTNVSRSQR